MMTRTLLFLSFIVLLASLFLPMHSQAAEPDFPHLNLQAEAEVQLLPDFIKLHIQIEHSHQEASVAKAFVDDVTAQLISLANTFNIERDDIDAAQISSQPQYEWQDKKRILLGQTLRRSVNIKLYKLDDYTDFINQLISLNIHRYQQTGFGFDKPDLAKNKALLKAIDHSRIKAELIAEHMGRKLGPVFQITETDHFHQPLVRSSMMSMAESSATADAPLEIKPQSIKAKVNVIYRLK